MFLRLAALGVKTVFLKMRGVKFHPPQFRESQRQICRCSTTTPGEEGPDVGPRAISDAGRHEVLESLGELGK